MRIEFRNAERSIIARWLTDSDVEIVEPSHPEWAEIAATAAPYVAPSEQDIAAQALAAERATMQLSFAQMLIGLVSEGWITAQEGRAWRDRVALPAPVVALIEALPEAAQFAAETRALAASTIPRTNDLVIGLASANGKTPEQLDDFFRTYARA